MNLKLLLVDDDQIDVMAFKRALKKIDLQVDFHFCHYAKEALLMLENEHFDCLFIDYLLPGINGLSLLKLIKVDYPTIPCSVLTSQGDEKLAVEMMKAGAYDYFPKSEVSPEKIQKILHSIIRMMEVEQQRKIAEKALKEKDEFIQKISLLSPNIIYVNDLEKGENIYRNNQIMSILGYSETDIKECGSKLFQQIIDVSEFNRIREHYINIRHNCKDGEVREIELLLNHKDGHHICLLARDTPFKRNKDGKVTEILGTAIDITQRKKAERELIEAKRYAEEAASAKSEFLSNMSHEIRTPMNAIIGLSDLLLKKNLKKDEIENLKAIKFSADNMMVIINDVLDFSKIEAGKLNIESIDFDLYNRIQMLEKTYSFRAKQKQIRFKINIDAQVPQYLKGDPFRLNQILVNLIGNALKFTEKGSVNLKIEQLEQKQKIHQHLIRFTVKDTGIGIPANKLDVIFESFSQANSNTTRKFGGTGLGLSITQKLTELQGGTIKVSSQEGKGSSFMVDIWYDEGQQAAIEKVVTQNSKTNEIEGARLLIAEDNPINQMYIKQLISKWKVDYTVCNNGQEALDEFNKGDFDIVLMDMQMPILDGLEATRLIRLSNHSRNNLPIIALTADGLDETKQKMFDAGINDFMSKPFKADELYNKMKRQLL